MPTIKLPVQGQTGENYPVLNATSMGLVVEPGGAEKFPVSLSATVNVAWSGQRVDASISSTVAVALINQTIGLVPVTSGGLSIYHAKALTTLNAASIKGSAGQVYHISVFNNGSTIAYLKLYNTATAPDVGSLSTVDVIMIPGNASGAGVEKEIANGVSYSSGIGIGLTQGMSDLDKTSATASAYIVTVYYK